MRAVAVAEFGGMPEVMDLPEPGPDPGEVLVRMRAAALNPFDWKLTDGALKDVLEHRFPLVMGVDGAGTVASAGPGVTRFRHGDEVFGQFMRVRAGGGSYAEYAVAAENSLCPAPKSIDLAEAAAMPTAGTTGLNLVRRTGIREDGTVLIVGATGGVGTFATQFGRVRGGHVIATAHGDAAERMRDLGAEEIVDPDEGPVAEQVKAAHPDGVDALIDLVSDADALREMATVVRPGGTVLSTVQAVPPEGLPDRDAENFANSSGPDVLQRLADEIDAGRVEVAVAERIGLDEVADAVARSREGRSRGKTVIVM